MKIIDMTDATGALAEYAQQVSDEPVIVTSGGKPVAALVPIENTDLETASLSTNAEFLSIIERSRTRHRAEGGISSEEIRRRMESSP